MGRQITRLKAALDQLGDQWKRDELTHLSPLQADDARMQLESATTSWARAFSNAATEQDGYRVSGRVRGDSVSLRPSCRIYSWQPKFHGRLRPRADGSALVGRLTWSVPTRLYTIAFPLLGAVFSAACLVVALWRFAAGQFSGALHILVGVGFGVLWCGSVVALSLWGARQSRRDAAYLRDWLAEVLGVGRDDS